LQPYYSKHKKIAEEKKGGEVIVLCYHTFLDRPEIRTDVSLDTLRSHIALLRAHGYRFVSFTEIIKGKVHGDKNILITIDDGHRSGYTAYVQVFKQEMIKPLYAIYPSPIGKTRYTMTWDQILYLEKEGAYIASHGYTHQPLGRDDFEKNPEVVKQEIRKSKAFIEKQLGHQVDTFVYPYGKYSDEADRLIKEAHYRYAFVLGNKKMLVPIEQNRSPYTLTRFMVDTKYHTDSIALIESIEKKGIFTPRPSKVETPELKTPVQLPHRENAP